MRPKKIVLSDRMELYKIVARVNSMGIAAVAEQLECDPTTLTRWLKDQGYGSRIVWGQTPVEEKVLQS